MVRGSEGGGDVKDCELASQNLLVVLCPKIRALSVGSVVLFDWICVSLAFFFSDIYVLAPLGAFISVLFSCGCGFY